MKMFGRYLKDYWKVIAAVVLISGIFLLVFYLYGVSSAIYGYAALVSGVCLLPMIIYHFYKYQYRHSELEDLKKRILVECDCVPRANSLIEADYQEALDILSQMVKKSGEIEEATRKDMVDYYTMWVHQIKNPITALGLLLQVEEGSGKKGMQQQLIKIEQYVEMVLQYLRLESMSSDLKLQEYKIQNLVNQAVKQVRSVFIYRKLSLEMEELSGSVISDEKWLVFVLEQILSNALKYTNEGKLSIYMDKQLPCTLVIQDTGIGIRSEDLPRIFEKGFTGYNGRMGKKSTGIGLYLCKRIMEKLGHGIVVSSVPGEGTQVRLSLYREELKTE